MHPSPVTTALRQTVSSFWNGEEVNSHPENRHARDMSGKLLKILWPWIAYFPSPVVDMKTTNWVIGGKEWMVFMVWKGKRRGIFFLTLWSMFIIVCRIVPGKSSLRVRQCSSFRPDSFQASFKQPLHIYVLKIIKWQGYPRDVFFCCCCCFTNGILYSCYRPSWNEVSLNWPAATVESSFRGE